MINQMGNSNTNMINNLNKTSYQNNLSLNPEIKNQVENKTAAGIEKKDINKINDCKTCSERKYQDVSDDGGVSFQSATKINPTQVASKVMGHEKEHYTREQTKAKIEGKEVVRNDIRLSNSICPECGKVYVSGGVTETVTKKESKPSQKALDKNEVQGINFDAKA